ncbi:hypothetical protein [Paenibacillus sp. DS2015]|uniref:hypothetical protein n=1 Tax=Paenibacillus sp. DS2015 TaxID=3373917 RepID=UPI003D1B4A69
MADIAVGWMGPKEKISKAHLARSSKTSPYEFYCYDKQQFEIFLVRHPYQKSLLE